MTETYRLADTRWKRALLTGAVLLVGSLVPSPTGRHPEFAVVGPDKLLHFLGHAGFAAALADALGADGVPSERAAVSAITASTFLGLVVGVLQRPIPGRVPERADLVAGTLGSVSGAYWWVRERA